MSARGARRAKPPVHRAARRIGKMLLAAMVVPMLAAMSYGAMSVMASDPAEEGIEAQIRRAGFDPVTPPNRLRGPGALYEVNGTTFRKVCDANEALIGPRLQHSPTLSIDRKLVENLSATASAELVERLKAILGAGRVATLRYKLTEVTIAEIALEDLYDIQNDLLNRKACQAAVDRSLAANLKVCQGYAALSATTSYTLAVDSNFDFNAQGSAAIAARAKLAIEEAAGTKLSVQSATELSGEGLYVGIQLDTRCIVPNTATEPSTLAPVARKEAGLLGRWLESWWSA